MNPIAIASLCVLLTSLLLLALFALYPIALWSAACFRPKRAGSSDTGRRSVSMLVAVRNGQSYIGDKIRNALELDYPEREFEIIVYSDGSTDDTERIIRQLEGPRVLGRVSSEHVGKAGVLNRGVLECRGEILVFSDADALLDRDALRALVVHFDDPRVGGVCGQRVISSDGRALKTAQRRYIGFDSAIKSLESRFGRITSNDGKLYAIRRDLFQPIPEAVTDDLYVCLSVIRQGFDFLFEPAARAAIRLPSRSASHEVRRRRRIVSRSLRGIGMMRELLDPRRFGAYSFALFVNKVLRRLVPICLVLLFAGTAVLAAYYRAAMVLLIPQIVFYAAALAYPAGARNAGKGAFRRLTSVPFYFCVGNYGTLLGLADFMAGRRVTRWDPQKSDG